MTTEEAIESNLFGEISPDLFSLFTSENGNYYADILEYLVDNIFLDAGFTERSVVTEGIENFNRMNDYVREQSFAGKVFHRLKTTGWIIEQRQGFDRVVDFDPAARILLDFLLDFKSGRLKSYGSEVVQVLSLIESAERDPEGRSSALSGAAKSSRGFLNHLRGLAGGMRKAEDAINSHNNFSDLFDSFFKNYVEKFIIADYKTIHTKANPFRYRLRIRELASGIFEDDLKIEILAQGYFREARAPNMSKARKLVTDDIMRIIQVFDNIDPYLDIIEQTNRRIEQKIRNTVRFLDEIESVNIEDIERVIERLGSLSETTDINTFSGQYLGETPIGSVHLFNPPNIREDIIPQQITIKEKSPARLKYELACINYRDRTQATPSKIETYLRKSMGSKTEIMGSELPIKNLDDFFTFSALPNLEFINAGELRGQWTIKLLPTYIENEWILRRDFVIENIQR